MSETKGGANSFEGFIKREIVLAGVKLQESKIPSQLMSGTSDARKTNHTICLLAVLQGLPFAYQIKSKQLSTLSALPSIICSFMNSPSPVHFTSDLHLDHSPGKIQLRCHLPLVAMVVTKRVSSLWS